MAKKAEEVTTQEITVTRIALHPKNYNIHTPEQIAELRASLREFGYVRTIVVQEPATADGLYIVAAGNGMFKAAKLEGYEKLECRVVPSSWSQQKVLAYLATDNNLPKHAQSDDVQLLSILREIREDDTDLFKVVGFSDDEYFRLLAEISGEVEEERVSLRAIDIKEPPEMAWVLVGVKLVHYGGIAHHIEQLAAVPDIILEVTVTD